MTPFPRNLATLIVNNCNLKKIESRIFQLSHLVTLNLADNKLVTVPADWSSLPNLGELILSRNALISLPSRMLTTLHRTLNTLDLSFNQLTELPSSLIEVTGLSVLKVDSNQLTSLPHGLSRLGRLKRLSASHNRITELPADVRLFKHRLENVDFFDNAFSPPVFGNRVVSINDEDGPSKLPTLFELSSRSIRKYRYVSVYFPVWLC